MPDSIFLSSVQLLIDEQPPTKEFLDNVFSTGTQDWEYEGTWHRIEHSITEDRFYWLYSNFGKPMPHRDIIIDTDTGAEQENPRAVSQVEPNNQLFAIYDFENSIFYTSSLKKRSFLARYLKSHTDSATEVVIKNRYTSIEQFLEIINSVETIKFTGERDLLSSGGDLMAPLKNIFGYGEPEEFSIEARYGTPLEAKLRQAITKLAGDRSAGRLKSLVCIGKDDLGFESVFNTDSFINKISISVQKDEQDLFPSETVLEQAVLQLKEVVHV